MPSFSVKKPFTVLVAVILIIVLGVVSYTQMTPDLLPDIELPYVLVLTTYPGESPENVEAQVTKPIEQAAATLDDIDSVSSTSGESFSMVILAFDEQANMDAALMNLRERLNMLASGWDDSVGTPQLLNISPSLLPTNVSAVSMEGMDITELSAYVENTLLVQLEGIDGVAGVTAGGLVSEYISVRFDEERMETVNKKIQTAVNARFDEAKAELSDAKAELDEGFEAVQEGQEKLDDGKKALDSARYKAQSELKAAQMQLDDGKTKLAETKLALIDGIAQAGEGLKQLTAARDALAKLKAQRGTLTAGIAELKSRITLLQGLQGSISAAEGAMAAFDAQVAAINADASLTEEQRAAAVSAVIESAEYTAARDGLTAIDAQLAPTGITRSDVPAALSAAEAALTEAEAALAAIDAGLAEQELSPDGIDAAIARLDTTVTEAKAGKSALEGQLSAIESGEADLVAAEAELKKQKDAANSQLWNADQQLVTGQESLDETSRQLSDAAKQLEDSEEQLDDAVQAALDNSDLFSLLTVSTASRILYAQNFEMPAGYVTDSQGAEVLVSVGDRLEGAEELRGLMLFDMGLSDLDPIYLSDVAEVLELDDAADKYARINGQDGVLLSFTKQSDRATATVSEEILDTFEKLEEATPGLTFEPLMDQGMYIDLVIDSVLENLLVGAVLAVIILLLFLRDIKPTFVVACSIPISLTFAVVLMYFSGVTLNLLSMAGLAVGVGMLVDNSIVVIENIYRLRRDGVPARKAAIEGAKEVAAAITSSTLTTVCVFVPILFVHGLTRQLFSDMALTVAYSLLASLVVALTLVPALASGALLRVSRRPMKLYDRAVAYYRRSLGFVLRHRVVTLCFAVLLLALSLALTLSRGFIYMPDMDSTQISVNLTLDEDADIEDTRRVSDEFAERVLALDGVDTVGVMRTDGMSSIVGMSTDGAAANSTTAYVVLSESRATTSSEMGRLIKDACGDLPCELSVTSGAMSDSMAMLSGSGIALRLYGNDLDALREGAVIAAEALSSLECTDTVSDGQESTTPVLHITVDKNAAMAQGLTVAQVYSSVAEKLSTQATATTMDSGGRDVIVVSDEDGLTGEDVRELVIRTSGADGKVKKIPLKDIAEFSDSSTLSSIDREGQRRYIEVSASLKEGYNVTLSTNEAIELMAETALPEGVSYEFTGENESIMDAMGDLLLMLLLGILIVYLIMVAQFQSLLSPLIVMATIPLAFTGGLLALAIMGDVVSIIAMVGFIMLVGVIVNNGIVLIDCANRLRAEGKSRHEAIEQAGALRMRPILMTALTTILALVPLLVRMGMGASMMQPVAAVCVGGLLYATLMTLYVVPALYDLLVKKPPRVDD